MILFTLLMLALVIAILFIVACLLIGSTVGMLIFGDIIVCAIIFALIIKVVIDQRNKF